MTSFTLPLGLLSHLAQRLFAGGPQKQEMSQALHPAGDMGGIDRPELQKAMQAGLGIVQPQPWKSSSKTPQFDDLTWRMDDTRGLHAPEIEDLPYRLPGPGARPSIRDLIAGSVRPGLVNTSPAISQPEEDADSFISRMLSGEKAQRAAEGPAYDDRLRQAAEHRPEDMESFMERLSARDPGLGNRQSAQPPDPAAVIPAPTGPDPLGDLISRAQTYPSVSADQIRQIMPGAGDRADQYAEALNREMMVHGINTPLRQAAFLSQISAETGDLRRLNEDFTYRSPQTAYNAYARLRGTDVTGLLNNPQEMANTVMAGRLGNGDYASGDGYRYRGRGLLQLTGRDNYERAGKALGLDLLGNPDQLVNDTAAAAKSAAWFFAANPDALAAADAGDIGRVGKIVNGGTNGAKERAAAYNRALSAFGLRPVP